MTAPNDLVLYQYAFSPFARRVIWYLQLRGIDYAQCMVPPYPPRPALDAIGVQYRRIPVLAHGRDVYCDTRLILSHLEETFPDSPEHPALEPSSPQDRAYTRMLEKWTVEAGIFAAAASMLSPDLPALKDPKFQKDRESFSGKSWSRESMLKEQGSGRAMMRNAFTIVEEQILGDGRQWVLGGDRPSRADIDCVWPFHWLAGIPGTFPEDSMSKKHFPKTYAWIERFDGALRTAAEKTRKPKTLKDDEAAQQVLSGLTVSGNLSVDPVDPLALKAGQQVESGPTDWGFTHKDKGKVVGLTPSELVIESDAPGGGKVLIHYPRIGFKIESSETAKL